MVLKFYNDIASPPVRAVYFTIKHLDVPVESINLELAKGDHKSEEYLKKNPFGTVPTIDDDGFVLLDSHAINIYLTTKYPGGEKLYPSSLIQRAVINERLFFETCELFSVLKLTAKKIFFKGATSIDEDSVEKFENGYGGLEIYLKKSQYVAGDSLTIADFSVLSTVTTMNVFVPIKKEKFPLLSAYLERSISWPYYAEINEIGLKKLTDHLKTKNVTLPQ